MKKYRKERNPEQGWGQSQQQRPRFYRNEPMRYGRGEEQDWEREEGWRGGARQHEEEWRAGPRQRDEPYYEGGGDPGSYRGFSRGEYGQQPYGRGGPGGPNDGSWGYEGRPGGYYEHEDAGRGYYGSEEPQRRSAGPAGPVAGRTQRASSQGDGYAGPGRDWTSFESMRGRTPFRGSETSEIRQDFSGKGPKGFKRSDERLTEEVNECLMHAFDIDASEIEVEVKGGEVTLKGTVPDRHMKHRAEDEVDGILGIRDVTNQLRVQSSSGRQGAGQSSSGQSSSGQSSSGQSSTTRQGARDEDLAQGRRKSS